MLFVCIVPLIPTVIIMGDSTIHPSWDRSGGRMAYLPSFWLVTCAGNLSNYLCFEVWVGLGWV
jgi:hypothetical protein